MSGLTVAIDAMGGDRAPEMVVGGVALAHERFPETRFILFGDEARVRPALDKALEIAAVCEFRHAPDVVTGDMKPTVALRSARRSSMRLAIEAVRDGAAEGMVSAGNTGALMAIAKIVLRTLPGIDRPAICSLLPTMRGESVMLDLGANVDCDAGNLVQFALMGDAFARAALGLESPSVGLLNIGAEDLKGDDVLREAASRLREPGAPVNFQGFIEGDDIAAGTVDVVVTDGFTGNVALKTAEGIARLYAGFLKGAFESSPMARFGYLFARHAIEKVRHRTDPRRYNGAMFMGLNGIVVKSHGGADEFGFANAVGVAIDLLSSKVNDRIRSEVARMVPSDPARAASG